MKLKHLSLTLLAGALALSTPSSAQWQHLGGAAFSSSSVEYTSMAIGAGDAPLIAFRDNSAAGHGKLSVMKYTAGAWSLVGAAGSSPNAVYDVHIAVDSATHTPYVAFVDSVNGITVEKFNGTAWDTVGHTGFPSNGQSNQPRLSIAGDGTPYVCYNDNNQSYKASVQKFSAGSWAPVGSEFFSATTSEDVEMAIDHNGTPYVLSTLSSQTGVQVQKFNGNNWVTVGNIGFDTADYATLSAIAFGPNNQLYVAVSNHNSPYKANVWTFNGTSWLMLGSSITTSYAYNLNLVISAQGVPFLSFTHNDNSPYKVSVVYYLAGAWHYLGNQEFSTGTAETPSLAVNSVGDVFVGYQDDGNGNAATVDVYLHNVGVHEVAGLNAFNLYPNPTTGKAQVTFKTEQATDVQLSVTNMMGQQVWADTRTASNGTESIDLSSVAKGLYTLQVKTTTGTENRLVEIK